MRVITEKGETGVIHRVADDDADALLNLTRGKASHGDG